MENRLRIVFGELVGQVFVWLGVMRVGGGLLAVRRAEGFEDAAGVVAATHGHAAGARDFEDLELRLAENLEETFYLRGGAGHLEHDGLGGEVDDAGAEDIGELKDLRARVLAVRVIGAGRDLDEAELADD